MNTGVHAIIQRIHADAEQHSNERYVEIKNEVDTEISSENVRHCKEYDTQRETLKKQHEYEYARQMERTNSRLKRELFSYQHQLVDEIFDMAVTKLRASSQQEFIAMFQAAIKDLTGSFILHLGALSDKMLDQQTIGEHTGLTITLSDETIPGKSGFVLRDELVEYNCLFEDVIEDKKSKQMASIMQEVFANSSETEA